MNVNTVSTFFATGAVLIAAGLVVVIALRLLALVWPPARSVSDRLSAYMQGDYQVNVIGDGCISKSERITIVAQTLPDAFVLQVGESTFCSGESITLRANVQSNVIYNWYKGDELLDETGHLLTVSVA